SLRRIEPEALDQAGDALQHRGAPERGLLHVDALHLPGAGDDETVSHPPLEERVLPDARFVAGPDVAAALLAHLGDVLRVEGRFRGGFGRDVVLRVRPPLRSGFARREAIRLRGSFRSGFARRARRWLRWVAVHALALHA